MSSIEQRIDELRSDDKSGASELTQRSVAVLKELAESFEGDDKGEFIHYVSKWGSTLAGLHPHMSAIRCCIGGIVYGLNEHREYADVFGLRHFVYTFADDFIRDSNDNVKKIARNACEIIGDNKYKVLLTHSRSSTVREVFRQLIKIGYSVEFIVTESRGRVTRPGEETSYPFGLQTSEDLKSMGIVHKVVPDILAGHYARKTDASIVGADSILGDGGLVNSAGTYHIALAAHDANKPFYVACETLKFDPSYNQSNADILLETLNKRDVGKGHLFDITPSRYINDGRIITEIGALKQSEIADIMTTKRKYLTAL
ncbi:hypothetical protein EPN87_04095 [archaeon]|nr:MAG: hypothetical protein EPN87_04095 [archaeon]